MDENNIELDLEEVYKKESNGILNNINDKDNSDSESNNSDNMDSDLDSDGSWSTFNSEESVLSAEYWVKLKKMPVQILCMESFDMTLTELEREGLDERAMVKYFIPNLFWFNLLHKSI